MNTPDSTRVIHGDEGCRDGHYRVKQKLREHPANGEGAKQAAELDANDPTSQKAQNPTDFGELRVGRASEDAAGIPAIWNTMLYGIGDMGPVRAPEAFLKINHVTGFDCQSCAWPSPDKKRQSLTSPPRGVLRRSSSRSIRSKSWRRSRITGLTSRAV